MIGRGSRAGPEQGDREAAKITASRADFAIDSSGSQHGVASISMVLVSVQTVGRCRVPGQTSNLAHSIRAQLHTVDLTAWS